MISCYLCNKKELLPVLEMPAIPIWTGFPQGSAAKRWPCMLQQCASCGHVQQSISTELEEELTKLYLSSKAQGSTPIGKGSWGEKRAKRILTQFPKIKKGNVLEIGCANTYLLETLKNQGASCTGIDPSLQTTGKVDDILLCKGFVNKDFQLDEKFDFIFSIAVFEHIKEISQTIAWISNHLNQDGKLFFAVPAFGTRLDNNDPALFMHEHIHYFTPASIQALLKKYGFNEITISELDDSYNVCAKKGVAKERKTEIKRYSGYQAGIKKVLDYVSNISKRSIALHGVCNALNNILGWSSLSSFGLFDNDETKEGKLFFGQVVKKPTKETIDAYDCIIITTHGYFDEIAEQYKSMGYKGEIIDLTQVIR